MADDAHHYLDRFRLDGRTALVTGASRNIGAAISRAFAEAGANLIVNARGRESLAAFAQSVRDRFGVQVTPIAADLAQPTERARLISEVEQRIGAIDIVVNNATGGGRPETGLATTPEMWRDTIEVNVAAPFELCRAFVPAMRARGRGAVINVLSTAAFTVVSPMLAYGAMKSALWTMTKYLARECAPEVRVNAICPGTVQEGGELKVASWSKLLPLTALGRVGDSNELAGAALFLASDASSYTTGQVIFVDGGEGHGMTDKNTIPDVTLAIAERAEAPVLANLLELYIHDLSEIFQIDIGPSGHFGYGKLPLYWEEADRRFPFLIRADGGLAGFALIARGSPATADPTDLDVAEFFVLRRHRRNGVGRQAAFQLWNRMPGHWVVRISEGNRPALPFWHAIVAEYTGGRFAAEKRPGSPHAWSVLLFESPADS